MTGPVGLHALPLDVADETLWKASRRRSPHLGRVPDTADLARMFNVREYQIANRLARIRERLRTERSATEQDWREAAP